MSSVYVYCRSPYTSAVLLTRLMALIPPVSSRAHTIGEGSVLKLDAIGGEGMNCAGAHDLAFAMNCFQHELA